ncbi:Nn.00g030730.m01.CDS01 [Neocucurbitaria sp. VM-36]
MHDCDDSGDGAVMIGESDVVTDTGNIDRCDELSEVKFADWKADNGNSIDKHVHSSEVPNWLLADAAEISSLTDEQMTLLEISGYATIMLKAGEFVEEKLRRKSQRATNVVERPPASTLSSITTTYSYRDAHSARAEPAKDHIWGSYTTTPDSQGQMNTQTGSLRWIFEDPTATTTTTTTTTMTAAELDISELLNFDVSLEEFCAFFALHVLYCEDLQLRFKAAGWGSLYCARLVYYYRGITEDRGPVFTFRNNLQKRQLKIRAANTLPLPLAVDFTANSMNVPEKIGIKKLIDIVKDYKVMKFTNGVKKYPTKDGRRQLTIAIEKAEELELDDLNLSELPVFIAKYNLGGELPALVSAVGDKHPDKMSLLRNRALVKRN